MAVQRILVVCPEPVKRVRTGVAIRLVEIARQLAREHAVLLAAPEVEPGQALPFPTAAYTSASLPDFIDRSDVCLFQGHVGNDVIAADPKVPLVADLYDPFIVENLAYAASWGPGVFAHDRATLERQLARGDYFLVASEMQRSFYLGMLALLGRAGPALYEEDRELRQIVGLVPFGVPDPAQVPFPERGGTFRTSLGLGGEPLLFFGGVYDWYDPMTALEALGIVRESIPAARLLFLVNPNLGTTPQDMLAQVVTRAKALGLEDNVILHDWIAWDDRGRALADADVGVIVHRPGFEADLSIRTRVLDFMWAGLPVVISEGGSGGEDVARAGAGIVVPPGDPARLARAILDIIGDGARRDAAAAGGRALAASRTWPKVVAPLLEWLRHPRRIPAREPGLPERLGRRRRRIAREVRRSCRLPEADMWAGGASDVPPWERRPASFRKLKRTVDVALGLPLLVASLPLQLLIALWIRLDSPGPALFRQRRISLDGRPFVFLKFRTMLVDARDRFPELYDERTLVACAGARPFKERDDPRVTRAGRFLRRTSLDELPNLWNVVRGDMSLVGPRPEIPELLGCYSAEEQQVFRVPPGVTGLPQVSGRNRLTVAETIRLDLEYARRASLGLDLRILLATLRTLLHPRNAY